jgi:hypothetical protein
MITDSLMDGLPSLAIAPFRALQRTVDLTGEKMWH